MRYQYILLLALIAITFAQDKCQVEDLDKIDCGYVGIDQQGCESKGCCWQPVSNTEIYKRMLKGDTPNANIPWCFYTNDFCTNFNFNGKDVGFTKDWYNGMEELFMQNINVDDNGAVCAAPDESTPGGSYFYHWMRDAALTMRAYMNINDYNLDVIKYNMEKYLSWVTHVQHEEDPNDISILIEPKFEIPTREPYTGGWCRPQTDGPGLRSGTLIKYANALLENGQEVSDLLWNAIKTDLDWVVTGWRDDGCDLWEEVRSTDFFWNRMAFYQSLTWGSELATKMGDSSSSSKYSSTAETIKPTIYEHWNGTYLFESTNREKDSAVVHALVELNEGLFDITGKETAGTINTLNKLFCSEYQINQSDDSSDVPGVLYGRYENDSYAGGNPWQLLTAALAGAFYQGASVTMEKNGVMQAHEVDHWREILDLSEQPTYQEFAASAKAAGDAVMYRMYTHVKSASNYMLSEQMDRNTGEQISAQYLTWSFANALSVLHDYVNNEEFQRLTARK